MNKLHLIAIFSLVIFSCQSKKDPNLAKLNKQRDELSASIEKQNTELTKVNEEIAKIQKIDNREMITPHTIAYQPFQHVIALQSNVSTDQDVMIYPEYAGTISWKVKEGQQVSKGQTIASISDGGMSQQIQQAQIQADLAKTAFDKQSRLWNDKIGSELQYLQAKTTYEAANKQISAMQSQWNRTKVKAPFTGTIDNLIVQTGQVVAPGMPLAKVINLGNMKVTADISEKYIRKVKSGTKVNIELVDINEKMQGNISHVSNFINPSNRTYSIEVPIANRSGLIKPNMTAKINIIDYASANAIVVPNSSIQTNANGNQYVYTLTNINGKSGVASKSMISIGESNAEFTEVLSGLKVGDIVIKEGAKTVVDKAKVKF